MFNLARNKQTKYMMHRNSIVLKNCIKTFKILLLASFTLWQTTISAQSNNCSLLRSTSNFDYTGTNNQDLIAFTQDCFRKLNVPLPANLLILELKNQANCYAGTYMNRPFLAFDVEWLNNIRRKSDWSSIFVIGHEIGHLIEKHSLKLPSKTNELDADTWGALLILSFDYPNENFNNDFPKIILETIESHSHPSGIQRLNHINSILANADRTILSSFGPLTFQIDRWTSDNKIKSDRLKSDLKILEKSASKVNLLRAIESLNYCKDYIDNKSKLLLQLIEYGIMLNQLTAEEAYHHLLSDQNIDRDLNYSIHLHRIFSHSSDFHYFADLVNLEQLKRQITEVNTELLSIDNSAEILKICVTLVIHSNENSSLENIGVITSKIDAIQKLKLGSTTDFYDALTIYNNFLGDYNTSLKYATLSNNHWKADYNLRNNSENIDLWSRENLCISMYNLGLVQFRLKNYSEALATFHSALGYTDRNYILNDIYYMLARTYQNYGAPGEALDYISKVPISEDSFELMVRGQILLANGRNVEAKYFLNKSCELQNLWSCTKLKQL